MTERLTAALERGRNETRTHAGRGRAKAMLLAATACASGLIFAAPAQAQDAELGEIVVTARKRQESLLNVPVIATAVTNEKLEQVAVKDVRDLARFVPGLSFGTAPGPNGTLVTIRGVGTTAIDPSVDQSIALTVDGFTFSQGMAYSAAMFDVGQVEVLKGPQSLFYGKSSPGGVISLRTADPTDRFEIIARAGYEFEADEKRGEFIISGPLSDDVKMRLAAMYTDAEGFYRNKAIPLAGTGALAPQHDRDARKGYVFRYTALWNPTDKFSARLKASVVHDHWFNGGTAQWVSCPNGTAPTAPLNVPLIGGGGEDCKLDRTSRVVDMDPAAFGGVLWYNGEPQIKNDQRYGSLEMNYEVTPEVTLTSLTGYAKLKARSVFQGGTTAHAGTFFAVQNKLDRKEFQQEFRLNSDFEGPLNFTAGAFYQDAEVDSLSNLAGNGISNITGVGPYRLPPRTTWGVAEVGIKTYSGFGQLRYKITPEFEIAGGARYTDETRSIDAGNANTGVFVPVTLAVEKLKSKTWSPELTISYRPSDTVTVFGSVKRGYKSGSFNLGSTFANGGNVSFGDEKVTGGEIGLKSRLFDRTLALDVAAYDYEYKGLQVGSSLVTNAGVPQSRTVNAGAAKVYGFEWDLAYRPPQVEGLTLNLTGAWTHARFTDLKTIPCFGGQLISEGCNQQFASATGFFTAQDLSDTVMPRAPTWQVNWGFDYERPLDNGMTLVFANSNQYFGDYVTFPSNLAVRPDFERPGYTKVNASVSLRGPEDRWEVALIGNNIFNKLTAGSCSNASGQNTTIIPGASGLISGGAVRGVAGIDEVTCRLDRGREVWVRFTYRPMN